MYDDDDNDAWDEAIPLDKYYHVTNDISDLFPAEYIEILDIDFDGTETEVNTDARL